MTQDELFRKINNAVLDLQSAELQTFEVPLRTLGKLLSHESISSTVADLTAGLNVEEFIRNSARTAQGMVGSARLQWPEDPDEILGLQLLTVRWLGADPDRAIGFSHDFYYAGPKVIAGIRQMTRQLIIPFVRDFRAHLERAQADMTSSERVGSTKSNEIFIVHGHDEGAREALARFILELGLKPIILHEQPNRGRTIIEKVEAHSLVGFAVVLLTPDDEGRPQGTDSMRPRARQNVVLELGYFLGRLGRDRVCALLKDDVEIPSDFSGVLWTRLDPGGAWRFNLVRELKAVGYPIDSNLIV